MNALLNSAGCAVLCRNMAVHIKGLFCPDRGHFATSALWDYQTGQCLYSLAAHRNKVWSLCFSADGHTLVSSSLNETIKLWDVQTDEHHRRNRLDRGAGCHPQGVGGGGSGRLSDKPNKHLPYVDRNRA